MPAAEHRRAAVLVEEGGTAEVLDEKPGEAILRATEILLGVHGEKHLVLFHALIKGCRQAVEVVFAEQLVDGQGAVAAVRCAEIHKGSIQTRARGIASN